VRKKGRTQTAAGERGQVSQNTERLKEKEWEVKGIGAQGQNDLLKAT